jgi:hypothetical protein
MRVPEMIEDASGPRATRLVYPESPRLRRIRYLCRLLDQSIVLPGGYRIGLDPIIGLVPGAGDFIAGALSCYLVWEAYRLGIPKRLIFQMLVNVAVEAIAGLVPVLGDVFDAVWKANMRNLNLVELAYHPNLKERSAWPFLIGLILGWFAVWLATMALILFILRSILSLFG